MRLTSGMDGGALWFGESSLTANLHPNNAASYVQSQQAVTDYIVPFDKVIQLQN